MEHDTSSNNDYGLTVDNCMAFLNNVTVLCQTTHVWPPPKQLDSLHSKWTQMQHLLKVAQKVMMTMRPQSRLLSSGDTLPDHIVLKRTHSDTSHHVLLPGNPNRNWTYMQAHSEVPGCQWFGQTYCEALVKLGEWRVFLVGGRHVYTVHTNYKKSSLSWSYDVATRFYTLEELR
jgi:hypothetical protein